MTTIAWDGKTLAVDSLVTFDGSVYEHRNKLATICEESKTYLAVCGEGQDCSLVEEWIRGGCLSENKPSPSVGFMCIFVQEGHAYMMEDKLIPELVEAPIASGSGWKWAQAAMDLGRNAIEAIEYASTKCVGTGGQVNAVEIQPKLSLVV